jgi:hypothetical protein
MPARSNSQSARATTWISLPHCARFDRTVCTFFRFASCGYPAAEENAEPNHNGLLPYWLPARLRGKHLPPVLGEKSDRTPNIRVIQRFPRSKCSAQETGSCRLDKTGDRHRRIVLPATPSSPFVPTAAEFLNHDLLCTELVHDPSDHAGTVNLWAPDGRTGVSAPYQR